MPTPDRAAFLDQVATVIVELDRDCRDIGGILQTVRLVRAASTTLRDLIAGYGELWSTRLFERLLRRRGRSQGRVQWLDARRVLRTARSSCNAPLRSAAACSRSTIRSGNPARPIISATSGWPRNKKAAGSRVPDKRVWRSDVMGNLRLTRSWRQIRAGGRV